MEFSFLPTVIIPLCDMSWFPSSSFPFLIMTFSNHYSIPSISRSTFSFFYFNMRERTHRGPSVPGSRQVVSSSFVRFASERPYFILFSAEQYHIVYVDHMFFPACPLTATLVGTYVGCHQPMWCNTLELSGVRMTCWTHFHWTHAQKWEGQVV